MSEIKVTLDKSVGQKVKVACKKCACDTNHLVLKSVEEAGSAPMEPDIDFYWSTTYQIIQCQGCDTISFRSLSANSEDLGPYETFGQENLYPSRTEGRAVMSDAYILPSDLERIYQETIHVLNGNQPILSGIGIRAIIETVSKEKNATGQDLCKKINNLVDTGVLTKDGAEIPHQLRVLGNKAAHEVKAHSPTELNLAMDVVEHLLRAVYILPSHAKRMFK